MIPCDNYLSRDRNLRKKHLAVIRFECFRYCSCSSQKVIKIFVSFGRSFERRNVGKLRHFSVQRSVEVVFVMHLDVFEELCGGQGKNFTFACRHPTGQHAIDNTSFFSLLDFSPSHPPNAPGTWEDD